MKTAQTPQANSVCCSSNLKICLVHCMLKTHQSEEVNTDHLLFSADF